MNSVIKFDIVARNIKFDEIWHQVFTLDEIWEGRRIDSWLKSSNCEILAKRRYTGLKDKNGAEIYEGDILADGAVVEWFDNLAWDSGGSLHPGFYTKKWAAYDSNDLTTELSYHDGFDDCEVIGNIYDSPELSPNDP